MTVAVYLLRVLSNNQDGLIYHVVETKNGTIYFSVKNLSARGRLYRIRVVPSKSIMTPAEGSGLAELVHAYTLEQIAEDKLKNKKDQ